MGKGQNILFQFKAKHNRKGPWEFGQLKLIQDLGDHTVCISKQALKTRCVS